MNIYRDNIAATEALLDKLNIQSFLEDGQRVSAIMSTIQDAYEDHEFPAEMDAIIEAPPFDGYIFNYMSEYEFMTYCNKRYHCYYSEEVITYLWNSPQNN